MKKEEFAQEMDSLKEIILKLLKLDINKKERSRELVDARYIYAKILKDRGHTLMSIGRSLKKDHTTIMHYIKQVEIMLKQDNRLAEMYVMCKEAFLTDKPHFSKDYKEFELISKIIKLTKENESLILERKNILDMKEKFSRISRIVDIIDMRTPVGFERTIEEKINRMFNGLLQIE